MLGDNDAVWRGNAALEAGRVQALVPPGSVNWLSCACQAAWSLSDHTACLPYFASLQSLGVQDSLLSNRARASVSPRSAAGCGPSGQAAWSFSERATWPVAYFANYAPLGRTRVARLRRPLSTVLQFARILSLLLNKLVPDILRQLRHTRVVGYCSCRALGEKPSLVCE